MAKKAAPKPRNPYVLHLVKKKQGAQVVSKKAQRSREKVTLRKECYAESKAA